MSKNLSKYIASFYYLDKSLIVLPVATGSISIYHLQLLLERLYEL